ncbi:MAG: hypothetical protein HYS39_01405 [Proteobacteria bacterium]|nr:hypothetical protein [Pseudomonadota bacterium]
MENYYESHKRFTQSRRRLANAEAYIEKGIDPAKYYEGVWSQVATLDEMERKNLILAYQAGKFGDNYEEKVLATIS